MSQIKLLVVLTKEFRASFASLSDRLFCIPVTVL